MAPEVIKGCYNYKCDIWSAAVTLHVILVNSVPFQSQNPRDVLEKIKNVTQIGFEDRAWKTRSIGSIELMKKIIECDHRQRITAEEAMEHHWLKTLGSYTVERSDIRACLINFKSFR